MTFLNRLALDPEKAVQGFAESFFESLFVLLLIISAPFLFIRYIDTIFIKRIFEFIGSAPEWYTYATGLTFNYAVVNHVFLIFLLRFVIESIVFIAMLMLLTYWTPLTGILAFVGFNVNIVSGFSSPSKTAYIIATVIGIIAGWSFNCIENGDTYDPSEHKINDDYRFMCTIRNKKIGIFVSLITVFYNSLIFNIENCRFNGDILPKAFLYTFLAALVIVPGYLLSIRSLKAAYAARLANPDAIVPDEAENPALVQAEPADSEGVVLNNVYCSDFSGIANGSPDKI